MDNVFKFIGPPGTGKTETLTGSVVKNSAVYGAESIVCCSLTRAAAAVLASRIDGIPPRNIGTLHALAFRALGATKEKLTEGHEGDFNARHASLALGKGIRSLDAPAEEVRVGKTPGDRLREHMDILRARRVPRQHEAWNKCRPFADAWDRWKADTGLMDFTDLLETCLRDVPACPGNPAVILCDEAQDVPQLGIDLLLKWGSACQKLIVAGDSTQCLYEWAGVSPRAFMDITTDPAHRYVINQSWRVPRAVHTLATKIEGWLKVKEEAVWKPRDHDGNVLAVNEVPGNAHAVVAEAARLADDGKTVMILAACSHMLEPILSLLRRHAIPFHNAYRSWRADWNPLRPKKAKNTSIDRLLAFLRPNPLITKPTEEDDGKGLPTWSRNDLSLWTEMLEAEGNLLHGAKVRVKAMHGDDAEASFDDFVSLFTIDAMKRLGVLDLHSPQAPIPTLLQALRSACLPEWKKKLDYISRIAETRGAGALCATPRITVGTVHCSPGDELIDTRKRGRVPISELTTCDRLVGWHHNTNSIFGDRDRGGYQFIRSERFYRGPLVVIETCRSRTRVTPNHRVVVRFSDEQFCERWVVYLMRRGDWWRIGICTSAHRPYRSGGVSGRLATEQGDGGWILGVYETRREAVIAEATFQAKYGITGLTFQSASNRILSDEDLATVHEVVKKETGERAGMLLADVGMSADWPLYTRATPGEATEKRNMRGNFVTEAANLVALSGRIQVLTTPAKNRKAIPALATVTTEQFSGNVYGLDVPPHHHYISGGAVVHNSVKGGQAQHVFLFNEVSRSSYSEWNTVEGRDAVLRLFYVGATRASESLTICGDKASGVQLL